MNKVFAILLLFLATTSVRAQVGAYDYLSAQFLSGWGKMHVISTNAETQSHDFTTADKKDDKVWMKMALQEIQKLEAQGWETQDFELTGGTFVWIMRKPKQ